MDVDLLRGSVSSFFVGLLDSSMKGRVWEHRDRSLHNRTLPLSAPEFSASIEAQHNSRSNTNSLKPRKMTEAIFAHLIIEFIGNSNNFLHTKKEKKSWRKATYCLAMSYSHISLDDKEYGEKLLKKLKEYPEPYKLYERILRDYPRP
jgi:hypothetical protein